MTYWILMLVWIVIVGLLEWIVHFLLEKKLLPSSLSLVLQKPHDWIARILVRIFLSWGILIFVISSAAVTDGGDAFSLWMVFGLMVFGLYHWSNKKFLSTKTRNLTLISIFLSMLFCATLSMILWYVAWYVGVVGWV